MSVRRLLPKVSLTQTAPTPAHVPSQGRGSGSALEGQEEAGLLSAEPWAAGTWVLTGDPNTPPKALSPFCELLWPSRPRISRRDASASQKGVPLDPGPLRPA